MFRFLSVFFVFMSISALAQFTNPELAYFNPVNILKNPGFENGKIGWSSTAGTFSLNTSTDSGIAFGSASASWDPDGAGVLASAAIAIPPGLYNAPGVVSCFISTADASGYSIQAFDGSTAVGSTAIVGQSAFQAVAARFTFPTSGTIQLRISAAGDEDQAYIDQCYVGFDPTYNVPAPAFAMAAHGSDCTFTDTGAGMGDFSTDASCTFTVLDSQRFVTQVASYVDTNNGAGIVFTPNNASTSYPASYEVCGEPTISIGGTPQVTLRLADASNVLWDGAEKVFETGTDNENTQRVCTVFTVTANTALTFKFQSASSSGTRTIQPGNGTYTILWTIREIR